MSDSVPVAPRPFVWFRNKFLAGLAVVIPLLVTFWILQAIYGFLQGQSEPLLAGIAGLYNQSVAENMRVDVNGAGFRYFTSFVGFLIPVLVLVGLGVVATNVIGARIVAAMDNLLLRLPMISFIYKSLKQVIDAFKGFGGANGFKRVVYVEYPSSGMWLIGFATGQFFDAKSGRDMTCVFLPTAPSPMTGFVIVAESAKVTDASLTLEEAMKMIFSGGLIRPERTRTVTRTGATKAGQKPLTADFSGLPKAEDHPEFVGEGAPAAGAPEGGKMAVTAAGKSEGRGWFRLRPKE